MTVTWGWRKGSAEVKKVCPGPIKARTLRRLKIASCGFCKEYRNYQIKRPLLPHPLPNRFWKVLTANMFVLARGNFLHSWIITHNSWCWVFTKTVGQGALHKTHHSYLSLSLNILSKISVSFSYFLWDFLLHIALILESV